MSASAQAAAEALPRWSADVVDEVVLGAPCRMYAERPRSTGSLLAEARSRGEDAYLVQGERRVTFADHERAIAALRVRLAERGVRAGDPVLILGANAIELVVALWATVRAGAVAVMGNAWWSEPEVAHALAAVDPALVVCDAARDELLPSGTSRLRYDEIRALSESGEGPARDAAPAPVAEDDPALVLFTSGTTGFAKGVQLSHRGVVANLQNLLVLSKRLPRGSEGPAPASVSMLSLPLFHIAGINAVLTAAATGGRLIFNEGRFEPDRIVEALEREDVRVWSAVPTMVSRVVAHLEAEGRTLPGLRTVAMGGSVAPEDLRRRVREVFPSARDSLVVSWGLTESGGAVTTAAGKALEARPESVGRIVPTAEVTTRDADADGTGELYVRAPTVMLGYWGEGEPLIDEERWLRTGDLGRVDEDGFVYVTGRAKDIIIRGGENIAASRVETALCGHPAVLEAAAVGLPHPELGEEVGAIVVRRAGAALDEGELGEFVRGHLARFELPAHYWLRDEPMPQNATGKVLKAELRDEWAHRLEQGPTP